jgi:predicted nucleic acid-binding protein
MAPPSFWPNRSVPIALDASAIINLNGSGRAVEIMRALASEVIVAPEVVQELHTGAAKGRADGEMLEGLMAQGLAQKVPLAESSLELFERLTIGAAAETLEDGEAATIALAFQRGSAAVIDESKGRRLCGQHAPSVQLLGSIELFFHPGVEKLLGGELPEVIFSSLMNARMHVLPKYHARIADLLGTERTAQCKSLPRVIRG